MLFAFFRKQHEFKRSHFNTECPLLANGSYKIKIRVLWIVFRHLISVVPRVVRVLKKAQQNKNLNSVLFAFFRKQHDFKRSPFDIECPLLVSGSYKIKIRVLWTWCSAILYQLCVVRVLKKGTAKRNLGSVLFKFELERSYFDKLLDSANFCHSLHHVSSVAFLVAEPWRYRIRCVARDSWPLNLILL